jgi:hypothetical protein
MPMKNSNDTIGNRTSDLPACRAVPQPTPPPRTPRVTIVAVEKKTVLHILSVCLPNTDEVTGKRRRLRNEKLYNLYCSPNIMRGIKRNEMGWSCDTRVGQAKCMQSFGGET